MSVRITQGVSNRAYLTNLNTSQYDMNKAMQKVETGRAFEKVSEDVSAGTNALAIRSRLYKNEQVQENIKVASEQLGVAEENLLAINEVAVNVQSEVLRALNGTNTVIGKDIFLSVLDNSKRSVMNFANSRYNDKYILGGTNAATQPFNCDENGKLTYNGVTIEDIEKNDGVYEVDGEVVPYNDDVYMDIGLDIKVVNGKVDPKTAYKISVSGLETLGYGKSEVVYENSAGEELTYEVSNNIYDIITEMSDALQNDDMDKLSALYGHMNDRLDDMMKEVSNIGTRCQFLDTTLARLEDENISLNPMQQNTEGIDDATEIMNYMSYRYAWNLTMQFGSSVIPKTLMDYVV